MRIDGAMPRTRLRISASASRAWSRASTTRSFAAVGSVSILSAASPRLIVSITSRCCAPSWRSRSMRRSSDASTSSTALRLTSSVSTRCSSAAVPESHRSTDDDLTMERHEALRGERRDRQQDDARGEGHERHRGRVERRQLRQPGQDRPRRRRVQATEDVAGEQRPHRDRQQEQRRAPERHDGRELEDCQREGDEHVADVPPPVGVEEQRREQLAQARAVGPVGVGDERAGVGHEGPPPLDAGDDPGPLDREHDEHDADADEQQRDAGRQDPDDRQEREQLHPEPGDDGAGGEPGRRVERSADEAPDDALLPLRVLGPEGAEDEEQPQEQERDADHAGSEPGCGGSVEVASSS